MIIDVRNEIDVRDVVHRAVQALAEGKLVAFPTETLYAVAAGALHENALARMVALLGDTPGRSYTLAVKSLDDAIDYVPDMTSVAQRLARRCWPGPVTLQLPGNHPDGLLQQLPVLAQKLVADAGRIRMRVPAHRLILDVMRLVPGPLVISSAGRSPKDMPTTAADVVAALGANVQMVLDDGRSQFAQPATVVSVVQDQFQIAQPGVVSAETLERLASMLILFVCTGNTCRSPMAEAICKKLIAARLGCQPSELEDRGITVTSAGIAAMAGRGPTAEAVEVMSQMGSDVTGHVTQPISDRLVKHADVIFTMTQDHRRALVGRWPEASNRTFILCQDQMDVADPIGGPRDLYRRCAEQITEAIQLRLEEINLPESSP